jgi:hypothetical protein
VNGVARGGLHDEPDERVGVVRHHVEKRPAPVHLAAKDLGRHAVAAVAGALDHRDGTGRAVVENSGQADHAFTTDRCDFDHRAVFEHRQHRTEPAAGKIHVSKRFAGFVQHGFERERNDGKLGKNAGVIGGGKGGQQKIGVFSRRRSVFSRRRSVVSRRRSIF